MRCVIYTIGFTKKTAEQFFGLLKNAAVRRILDVRLKNSSQLAGFSKAADLQYFAREILGVEYEHALLLAPTQEMLDTYRKGERDWQEYEEGFRRLLKGRAVETKFTKEHLDGSVLLCSEHEPEHCHRRLVAEYFQKQWSGVEVIHLM